MKKFLTWYESLPTVQRWFFYILVVLPVLIPGQGWPEPMKDLLVIENLCAGALVCYELYKMLHKKSKPDENNQNQNKT